MLLCFFTYFQKDESLLSNILFPVRLQQQNEHRHFQGQIE